MDIAHPLMRHPAVVLLFKAGREKRKHHAGQGTNW